MSSLPLRRTLWTHTREDLREFFFLEAAERQSSQFTPSQRDGVRAYADAAKRRIAAAKNLRDPSDTPAALLLYRDALACLARALLLSEDPAADPAQLTAEAAWDKAMRLLRDREPDLSADIAFAERTFASADPLAFDRLSVDDASRYVDGLEGAARWLGRRVEPRSPELLKRTRLVRQSGGLAFGGAVLAWAVLSLFSSKDLALNKPVHSTPPGYDTAATGAVDGEKNGRFGYHSQEVDQPWLTVDLEKPYDLKTIKVFGRGECCFDQSIPLAAEISSDDVTFRKIGVRTIPFTESDPWVISAGSVSARYVRLRTERRSVLVLGEVEVYGKATK